MVCGQDSYTHLVFADDVCLLAELLELLIPVLETMASEALRYRVRGELAEDKGPCFGHKDECAIDHHSSRPTGCGS